MPHDTVDFGFVENATVDVEFLFCFDFLCFLGGKRIYSFLIYTMNYKKTEKMHSPFVSYKTYHFINRN